MKSKTVKQLAAFVFGACLATSAFAWPDTGWTGLANDGLWTSSGNWSGGVVPGGHAGDTNGAIQIDAANGWSTVTIPAGTNIICDAAYATIYGPEWGVVLDIRGILNCSWYLAPVGPTSVINMYTNSAYYAEGLGLGNNWWYWGGAGVTLNMMDNAQMGINYLFWGGFINLKGSSVLSITNGLDQSVNGTVSDATRAINLAGGTMVLPAGFTATVNDWISRGVLLVYGVPNDSPDIVIDEANATWPGRTVVYTTATNGIILQAVHITVPRTSLHVGGLEQAQVFADYPLTTNVNVTTSASVSITYHSTATNVATVTSAGMVNAVGVGSATIWAIVGTFSNSVAVTVSTYTNQAVLMHRYSFSDNPNTATTVADSVPGNSPTWDGTLNGSATLNGSQLVLDGSYGFVQFPAGIITNLDAVSVETWASFGSIPNWAVLFAFGDTTGSTGFNYLSCQPHTGAGTVQTGIKNATTEENPNFTPVLDNYTNVYIAAVFHPEAGYCSIYTNGVLAAIDTSINIIMSEVTATGDPYNYLGQSLWSADPYLPAYINEFRIYSGPLSAAQISADAALGPDQLMGTSTHTSLAVARSGANLVFSWPTSSALVTLLSSPTLGADAVWTPVAIPLTVAGGNYQASLSGTNATRFFRLQQ